jgi:hypothetical protein
VFAGLALVFLGLVITAFSAIPPEYGDPLVKRKADQLTRAALYTIGAFCISLASVGVSLAWLSVPGGEALYDCNLWLFVFELVCLVILVFGATFTLFQYS